MVNSGCGYSDTPKTFAPQTSFTNQSGDVPRTGGFFPNMAATLASSAEDRYTLAPLPSQLGKFRVEVKIAVLFGATRA